MSKLTESEAAAIFAKMGQKALRKKYDIETKEKRKVYFSHLGKLSGKVRGAKAAKKRQGAVDKKEDTSAKAL